MEREIRLLAVQTNRWECAEVQVFAALARQVSTSHNVRILLVQAVDETTDLPHPDGAPSSALFAPISAVEVVPLDLGHLGRSGGGGGGKLRSLLRLAWQMPGLLARVSAWEPDAVYSAQQVWDIYLAVLLAGALRRPRLTHLHYLAGPWLGRGVTRLLRSASSVVCVSDYIRRTAHDRGVPEGRTRTVYNSLLPKSAPDPDHREEARRRLRRSLGLDDTAQIILMIAALSKYKGQDLLIEAFARAAADCPGAHLALAGAAGDEWRDYAAGLRSRVRDLDLQGRVHFLGFRRDVPDLLLAGDVFAHPSHFEALSNAVQEASRAGLPVVAWDEGGVAEVVRHGVTGLLAPTGDVPALAACLTRLLKDPALAGEMGRRGQERVCRVFSAEAAAAAFHRALRTVTPPASPPSYRRSGAFRPPE